MIRLSMAGAALVLVAACNTAIPNDVAQGVSTRYAQDRDTRLADLRGVRPAPTAASRTEPAPASARTVRRAPLVVAGAEAARPSDDGRTRAQAQPPRPAALPQARIDELVALALAEAEYTAPPDERAAAAPQPATRPAAPRVAASHPRISDEQEFEAVAARESIESDAERRARMQADRVVIRPTEVPDRPSDLGPNVIQYALSTSHGVGERRHARSPLWQGRHDANCRDFRSPDLAQEWFLANGGPARDRRALDPDGDGFACGWTPEPYRMAARTAGN